MSSECPGKTSWPELLGTNGDYAVSVIERENREVKAVVVLNGFPVTGDFTCDRVCVRVNNDARGIIIQVPTVG